MAEARDERDATADAVKQGYTEAMIWAKVWKTSGGRIRRPWSEAARQPGLTGGALEAALGGLATMFPGNVKLD